MFVVECILLGGVHGSLGLFMFFSILELNESEVEFVQKESFTNVCLRLLLGVTGQIIFIACIELEFL